MPFSDPWGFSGMNRHSILNASFWGDSLMQGSGDSAEVYSVPGAVSLTCGSRAYNNLGVGGDSSTDIKTRLLAGTPQQLSATTVIWAGKNNYLATAGVQADIAAMVAFLGHTRYLVIGIFNGTDPTLWSGTSGYTAMTALNSALSATYGVNYVETITPLVAAGAPAGAYPDATNYGHGIAPAAIMADTAHLNDAGYAIVAGLISPLILARGW